MHPINLLTAVLLPNPHEARSRSTRRHIFLFFILFVSLLGQLELSELVTTSGHDGSTSCCDS